MVNGYACMCQDFFGGTNCEIDINPCLAEPCQNGGECTAVDQETVVCQCQVGYSGEFCELLQTTTTNEIPTTSIALESDESLQESLYFALL